MAMENYVDKLQDERAGITKACGLSACAKCDEASTRCLKCVDVDAWVGWLPRSFVLDGETGECYLPFEVGMDSIGWKLLCGIILIIVVAALVQGFVIRVVGAKKPTDTMVAQASDRVNLLVTSSAAAVVDKAEMIRRSKEAIRHGLTSLVQRQLRDWRNGQPERYGYRTNVSKEFIVGVGLPLFYGFKGLVFFSSLVIAVVLFIVQKISGLREILKDLDDGGDRHVLHDVHEALAAYAEYMFYGCAFLYFVLLGMAICYSSFQRRFKRFFDAENNSMSDYTLELSGVSKNETDETKLLRKIETHLMCPGQVLGVSIAYDLTDSELNGQIFDMMERRFINEDVRFNLEGSSLAQHGWGYDSSLARPEHLKEDDDAHEFQKLWDDQKFKGSGSAFVVFKTKSECDAVRMKFAGMWMADTITPQSEADVMNLKSKLGGSCWGIPIEIIEGKLLQTDKKDATEQQQPFARLNENVVIDDEVLQVGTKIFNPHTITVGQPVILERLVSVVNEQLEPTATLWWNFGMRSKERKKRSGKSFIIVLITFVALVGLVYLPLLYYLATPWALAAGNPGFMCSQMQGILLGIAGNILGIINWNAVCSLGHTKKPNQDIIFVRYSLFTNFFNTLFFLFGGLYHYLVTGFNSVDMTRGNHSEPDDIVSEWALYKTYYFTLIPGWLFSGVVTGKLMGLVVPVLQNFILLNVVFTMKCLPGCLNEVLVKVIPWNPQPDWLTARYAEHIFEPPEVALAWEYGQYIVTPSICCLALFMMGPTSWKTFLILSLWVAFMYVLHRLTLRISKKQMTGAYIEEIAERAWGIPLGIVLAACGFWGVRCEKLGRPGHATSYWTSFFLFICGLLLHQTMLRWFSSYNDLAFDSCDIPYEETKQCLRYTWFNTNPVHVLKSCFYPQKMGNAAIIEKIPFEYGKEYLLLRETGKKSGHTHGALTIDGEPTAQHGCLPGSCGKPG